MEFDFNEIRKRLEFCNAQLLKSYFAAGLTENFIQQLIKVLQQQFKPDYYRNVEGSVFQREDLELKIIKPEFLQMAETAVQQVAAGSPANLGLLASFADDIYSQSANQLEEAELFEGFKAFVGRMQKGHSFSRELRAEFAVHYKNFVLSRLFLYDPEAFGVMEEGFRALFLINGKVSEPSETEKKISDQTKNCLLFIMAGEDYVRSGVSLSLVYSGTCEKLYQGPLEPTATG